MIFTDAQADGTATALTYPFPEAAPVFVEGTMESYQSQLLDGEYTNNGAAVTGLTGARTHALGTIVLRDQVFVNFASFGLATPFLTRR